MNSCHLLFNTLLEVIIPELNSNIFHMLSINHHHVLFRKRTTSLLLVFYQQLHFAKSVAENSCPDSYTRQVINNKDRINIMSRYLIVKTISSDAFSELAPASASIEDVCRILRLVALGKTRQTTSKSHAAATFIIVMRIRFAYHSTLTCIFCEGALRL